MDQIPTLQTVSQNNIMLQDHKLPGWYHVVWQVVTNSMHELTYQITQHHPQHHILIFTALWTSNPNINPYPTAFPYGNGMVLHFYQQQESSTTKTVHKVINKGLKAYV